MVTKSCCFICFLSLPCFYWEFWHAHLHPPPRHRMLLNRSMRFRLPNRQMSLQPTRSGVMIIGTRANIRRPYLSTAGPLNWTLNMSRPTLVGHMPIIWWANTKRPLPTTSGSSNLILIMLLPLTIWRISMLMT